MSSLDKLDIFDAIKVCNEYIYNGKINDDFNSLFYYYTDKLGKIIITDIKSNGENLSKYLLQCTPKYITLDGWKKDISKIKTQEQLPAECVKYIRLLENLINIPITTISVGPTREDKIVLDRR